MKNRVVIRGFSNQPTEQPDEQLDFDFFEQSSKKRIEQAKKFISAKYLSTGNPDNREFRTSMELQYEIREMIDLSTSTINEAMNELGFQVQFLDEKPNWVLYEVQKPDYLD